jgi:hypothetical protein
MASRVRTAGSGAQARIVAAIARLRDAGVVGLRRGRQAAAVTPVRSGESDPLPVGHVHEQAPGDQQGRVALVNSHHDECIS